MTERAMTEAERTMELRRATGMPVLECREAVRKSDDRADQLAYLRRTFFAQMPHGVTWWMPPELDDGNYP